MLRMTRTQSKQIVTFRLEGKLLGPWVDELAATIGVEPSLERVELDLTDLTFVDMPGATLLRALIGQGVKVAKRSDFVAAMLEAAQ